MASRRAAPAPAPAAGARPAARPPPRRKAASSSSWPWLKANGWRALLVVATVGLLFASLEAHRSRAQTARATVVKQAAARGRETSTVLANLAAARAKGLVIFEKHPSRWAEGWESLPDDERARRTVRAHEDLLGDPMLARFVASDATTDKQRVLASMVPETLAEIADAPALLSSLLEGSENEEWSRQVVAEEGSTDPVKLEAIKLNTAVRSLWLLQYVRSLLLKGPTAERQAEGFQPVADLPDEDLGHDGADGKEEAAAAGERGGGGGPTAEDS